MTPTFDQIIDACSARYGVPREDVMGTCRRARTAMARHTAMYLVRELLCWTWAQIGQAFGGRDHTSVMHAHRKVAGLVTCDSGFRSTVDAMERRLTEGAGV